MSKVYGFNDIADITWYGDSAMTDFLTQKDHLVKSLEETMSETAMRDVLFRQVEMSTALAEDIALCLPLALVGHDGVGCNAILTDAVNPRPASGFDTRIRVGTVSKDALVQYNIIGIASTVRQHFTGRGHAIFADSISSKLGPRLDAKVCELAGAEVALAQDNAIGIPSTDLFHHRIHRYTRSAHPIGSASNRAL